MPELPIYSASLLNTNVKYFAKYINNFIKKLKLKKVILVGNSLGGHVALVHAKLFPSDTKALILTGSSGLYENAMGDTYPRRGDYEFIKTKTQKGVFSAYKGIVKKEDCDQMAHMNVQFYFGKHSDAIKNLFNNIRKITKR